MTTALSSRRFPIGISPDVCSPRLIATTASGSNLLCYPSEESPPARNFRAAAIRRPGSGHAHSTSAHFPEGFVRFIKEKNKIVLRDNSSIFVST